jgi:hypothetical protein
MSLFFKVYGSLSLPLSPVSIWVIVRLKRLPLLVASLA